MLVSLQNFYHFASCRKKRQEKRTAQSYELVAYNHTDSSTPWTQEISLGKRLQVTPRIVLRPCVHGILSHLRSAFVCTLRGMEEEHLLKIKSEQDKKDRRKCITDTQNNVDCGKTH